MSNNDTKILRSIWFDNIGIVQIYDGFNLKFYIGVGHGIDQEEDEKYIAKFGRPFYPESFGEYIKNAIKNVEDNILKVIPVNKIKYNIGDTLYYCWVDNVYVEIYKVIINYISVDDEEIRYGMGLIDKDTAREDNPCPFRAGEDELFLTQEDAVAYAKSVIEKNKEADDARSGCQWVMI